MQSIIYPVDNNNKWFVFYTKSRQEKKVDDLLTKSGYQSYLPLQTTVRQWSDRKKKVVAPLFSSYIFVRAAEHEISTIVTTPGVAWNIRYNDRPAVVRDEEINMIKRFLDTGYYLDANPLTTQELEAGDKAKIIDGPLAGIEGRILGDHKDQRFVVEIDGINQVIRVQIPAFLLQKL